jgi:hypothetical protein
MPTPSCTRVSALAANAHTQGGSCGFGRHGLCMKVIPYLCSILSSKLQVWAMSVPSPATPPLNHNINSLLHGGVEVADGSL